MIPEEKEQELEKRRVSFLKAVNEVSAFLDVQVDALMKENNPSLPFGHNFRAVTKAMLMKAIAVEALKEITNEN
jgi:hypothetical protein